MIATSTHKPIVLLTIINNSVYLSELKVRLKVMNKISQLTSMLFVASGLFFGLNPSAMAAPVVWTFNLPSTAVASQSPPYASVATLSLTQIGSDVQFFLDPNELNAGASPATSTFVHSIDFVYSGAVLTAANFAYNAGASVDTFSYEVNQNNLDAGYTTQDQHVKVDFFSKNSDGGVRFDFTETSTWTIKDVSLTNFTTTYATSGPKPSPIYGVISLGGFSGGTSNWVAAVPEPETYGMMLVGLALVGFAARRRKNG